MAIISSFALLRQESKCLTLTQIFLFQETAPEFFCLPTSLFAFNISNMKYLLTHSSHHTDLTCFLSLANTPDSFELLHTLDGKFKNVYRGFYHGTCFGNMCGECRAKEKAGH